MGSGFGMLISEVFKDATTQILACLMHSVIIDPVLSGLAPELWKLRKDAIFTELRWRRQALIGSELIAGYPEYVRKLPPVKYFLDSYFMDPEKLNEEKYEAYFYLLAGGLLMRFCAFFFLLITKYSAGGNLGQKTLYVLKHHVCTCC